MTQDISQTNLLRELEQVVEGELNRHLDVAKEWFPHDYMPWSEGRNFDGLMGGDPWTPDDADIPEVARTALIVNLLTEDNLPSYHHEIAVHVRPRQRMGRVGAPVDGRGRSPRHRDARLHAGQADGRPGGAGAVPDDPHVARATRRRTRRRAAVAGLRLVPGAGHPGVAPQHRPVHDRPDVPRSCSPGSRPTRTST